MIETTPESIEKDEASVANSSGANRSSTWRGSGLGLDVFSTAIVRSFWKDRLRIGPAPLQCGYRRVEWNTPGE
ncbi:MAG TPA: hypothetical protein VH722_16960, partial [Alphaproteobacteria bacterium]|nr:hypothetical protein [Alphaproteobacteria bacterium]